MAEEDNYTNIILEEVRGQYKAIQEGLDNLQGVPKRLNNIERDVSELKFDMKIIKGVIREHSGDIAELKIQSHIH